MSNFGSYNRGGYAGAGGAYGYGGAYGGAPAGGQFGGATGYGGTFGGYGTTPANYGAAPAGYGATAASPYGNYGGVGAGAYGAFSSGGNSGFTGGGYRSNNSGGNGGGGGGVPQDRQQRSVFVGNIPYKATETELIQIFSQAGSVVAFRLVNDRDTGRPKGFGFCEYADPTGATTALEMLNGTELHGRPLRVGSSK